MRKKEKEIERINGQLKTRKFSCSLNKEIIEPLIDMHGGGTGIIEEFFIKRFNKEDSWELQNFMTELLFERAGIGRRDNLTKEIEKSSCEDIVNFYTKKLQNKPEMNENERETIKMWINDAKKIKEKLK